MDLTGVARYKLSCKHSLAKAEGWIALPTWIVLESFEVRNCSTLQRRERQSLSQLTCQLYRR